jgi:serine/threonine protein kinase
VVKLIDVIGATDKLVIIVMRWLSLLGNHFSGLNASPIVKSSLVAQFLAGIQFIHNHGFAHLDLKPGNILLNHVDGLAPWLSIIDFGISVCVQDENTTVTGFCGTPYWTAPEVGTEHGPKMTYSAIWADLWSCGRMLEHFGSKDSIRDKLLDPDPSRRPSLDAVFHILSMHSNGTKRGHGNDGGAFWRRRHAMPNRKDL